MYGKPVAKIKLSLDVYGKPIVKLQKDMYGKPIVKLGGATTTDQRY